MPKVGGGGGHPNAAVGMLHWQAGQIAQPLRALARTHDLGPILGAAAHTAQALLTLCAVADPDDARGLEPLALLTDGYERYTARRAVGLQVTWSTAFAGQWPALHYAEHPRTRN